MHSQWIGTSIAYLNYCSMEFKNKLKIKEFSLLCGVSVKTLRYYEQIGLVKPEAVDIDTGYRYYGVGQMQQMAYVRNMKDMGYSLEEISDLFALGNLNPSPESLEQKLQMCQTELIALQHRIEMLHKMIDSHNKIQNMEKIFIQPLPEIIVASHRETIPSYNDLGRLCVEVIGPEMARIGCKCPLPGYCYTIDHNIFDKPRTDLAYLASSSLITDCCKETNEYHPTNIDIEYCEQVDEMYPDSAIIQFKRVPAVDKAVCIKHYGPYEHLYDSYVVLFQYIEAHGLKCAAPPRANYIDGIWNQENPEKWLTIIQIPVEGFMS